MQQAKNFEPSTPATNGQIAEALDVLFKSMRFHPGVDHSKALFGYVAALQGFTADAISAGILKFLRGECDGVNPRFCPHPPELAQIIRTAVIPQRLPRRQQPERIGAREIAGERERMRLKMPMWRHAWANGLIGALDVANREGLGSMVVLAQRWGIPVPEELLADFDRAERDWRLVGDRARAAMEANPPPFMRRRHAQAMREHASTPSEGVNIDEGDYRNVL